MPLVSVIMTSYNDEHNVGQAVSSVRLQDYEDFELVIVNDASTDKTPMILKTFAAQDHRIVLLHNDINLGPAASRNRAIEIARGDLIAIMDADDIAMPHRLSGQLTYLREHPDVDLLASWAIGINEGNEAIQLITGPIADSDIRRQLRCLRMPFVHSTLMFRRKLISLVGLYDARFYRSQDFHFCHRAVEKCKVALLPEFLVMYRLKSSSRSNCIRDRYRWCMSASWDCLKRYPTLIGAFNLLRSLFLSLLPGFVSMIFLRVVYWFRRSPREDQKSDARCWISKLEEQTAKTLQGVIKELKAV